MGGEDHAAQRSEKLDALKASPSHRFAVMAPRMLTSCNVITSMADPPSVSLRTARSHAHRADKRTATSPTSPTWHHDGCSFIAVAGQRRSSSHAEGCAPPALDPPACMSGC
jgi:hypothetical protein